MSYKAQDAAVLKAALNQDGVATKEAFDAAVKARIAEITKIKYGS